MTNITRSLLSGFLALSCCLTVSACGAATEEVSPAETNTPFLSSLREEPKERKETFFAASVSPDEQITLTWEGDSTLIYEVTRTFPDSGITESVALIQPGSELLAADSFSDSGIFCTYRLIPYADASAQANNEPCGEVSEITLRHGFLLEDGYLRYYDNNEPVTNTDINGLHFDRKGYYTCGDKALDEMIANLITELTTPEMSRNTKLSALYDYLTDRSRFKYGAARFITEDITDWETDSAKAFLEDGIGNCFSYAAAVMLFARALGFEARTVIGQCAQLYELVDHCWTEVIIDGKAYLCDAEMEAIYAPNHHVVWDLFLQEYGQTPTTYYLPEVTP